LFEIAWEVCNQVGGIYQVLRSKAELMVERWREDYCLSAPTSSQGAALSSSPRRGPASSVGWRTSSRPTAFRYTTGAG
jgi:hypothetical protein